MIVQQLHEALPYCARRTQHGDFDFAHVILF
jgi:hypothetical protein